MLVFHSSTFNKQPIKYTTPQVDQLNNQDNKNHEIIAHFKICLDSFLFTFCKKNTNVDYYCKFILLF